MLLVWKRRDHGVTFGPCEFEGCYSGRIKRPRGANWQGWLFGHLLGVFCDQHQKQMQEAFEGARDSVVVAA